MIQKKDYTALFIEYFEAEIRMIFYGERRFELCMDDAWEIENVQAEIMCSIPIEFRKEFWGKLKEGVDEGIKWWFKGYLKWKEERKTKEVSHDQIR
jgi:hypothetical protein